MSDKPLTREQRLELRRLPFGVCVSPFTLIACYEATVRVQEDRCEHMLTLLRECLHALHRMSEEADLEGDQEYSMAMRRVHEGIHALLAEDTTHKETP